MSLALGGVLLRLAPPQAGGIYPPCPFFQATGLLCPGCGMTRALAALFRGDFHSALRQNVLFVLLLPFALAYGVEAYRRAVQGELPVWPRLPRALPALLSVAALAFAVVRNLH